MAKEIEYFRIKNWKHYQHRDHKKTMPWIRLHVCLLDDGKFNSLNLKQQLFWIKLLLISGRNCNKSTKNLQFYSQRFLLNYKTVKSYLDLFESIGLIETYHEKSQRADSAPEPLLYKSVSADTALPKIKKEKKPPNPLRTEGFPPHPNPLEIWNDFRGELPCCLEFSPKRVNAWKSRWKEKPDREYWEKCVHRISQSSFCRGENNRGWVANIDFLLRPDTHLKISEGQYDSKAKNNSVNSRLEQNVLALKNVIEGE